MAFLWGLLIAAVACVVEAWGFMLIVGMTHLHILDLVQPISYGVAFEFVLVTLPVQAVGLILSLMGDS